MTKDNQLDKHEIIRRNFDQLLKGLDACLQDKLIAPALILLYSSIDIAGYLNSNSISTKERFVLWCNDYLLKAKPLACTSLELYGARCGVIHAMSPDSDLSSAGKVRRIVYSWGDSDVDNLQEIIEMARMPDYVAMKVEEIVEAFRLGESLFIEELKIDQEKAGLAQQRARKIFTDVSVERTQKLLDWGKSMMKGVPSDPPLF